MDYSDNFEIGIMKVHLMGIVVYYASAWELCENTTFVNSRPILLVVCPRIDLFWEKTYPQLFSNEKGIFTTVMTIKTAIYCFTHNSLSTGSFVYMSCFLKIFSLHTIRDRIVKGFGENHFNCFTVYKWFVCREVACMKQKGSSLMQNNALRMPSRLILCT